MSFTRYKLAFQFVVTFFALSLVPALYFYSEYKKIDIQAVNAVEQSNRNKLEYASAELQTTLTKINLSLRSLSTNGLFNQALLKPSESNINALKDFWLLVTQTQGYYSQLRLLDVNGQELIRINSSERVSEIVDDDRLQYKGERDYFAYAQTLKPNELGTFGIDLEHEFGEVVYPLTPSYRVIIPLQLQGELQGYFVANLDLKRIYKRLAYKRNLANLPSVVNTDGYYLMSNHGQATFGHLIERNSEYNLSNQHPLLWEKINQASNGTVRDGNRWFSFQKSFMASKDSKNNIIFIIESDHKSVSPIVNDALTDLLVQASFLTIIILLITFGFVTWNYNHQKNSMASKIARAAMNGMSAMVITDHNNRIVEVNEEFTRVSGYELIDVVGKQPSLFSSGKHNQEFYMAMWKELEEKGIWEGEVVNKRRDGTKITEILRIQTVRDQNNIIQFYVASFVDITHRKELEDRLRELSERDPLTSLWNRRKFDNEMTSHSIRVKRYPDSETTSLALLDIDHFKRINDKYGHDEGDNVIINVAKILTDHLRESDLVARIGGEEFALIMPHTSIGEAEIVVNRLRTAIHLETSMGITVSAGVTDICSRSSDSYKRADIALYESKSLGRNQVSVLSTHESESIA
ncbi:sensor domain-containing diguanylate cyclase [Vibrio atypicus]|uniref:sensor domain-containing diguanylate cyclase n=1 Tax=Vibrio atypicus TaxID=558271 RepID=UPI003736BF5A